MKTRSVLVASAAAALLMAGAAGTAWAEDAGAEAQIKCEGVNSCKGQGDCKTAQSECKGHNGCGGKGFLMMTPKECEAAKAKAAEQK